MIKLVIFDLDGTLLDVSERYYRSVKNALKKAGFNCSSKPEVMQLKKQNLSGMEIISTFIPADTEDREKKIKKIEKERYRLLHSIEYLDLDKPFEDTCKTLETLKQKGVKMAILTLRDYKEATLQQMENAGLTKFFEKIVLIEPRSGRNHSELKFDYAKKICRELKVKTDECCMVGDSLNEVEAGSKMNSFTVGVTCGLTGENALAQKCNKVIFSLQELLDVI